MMPIMMPPISGRVVAGLIAVVCVVLLWFDRGRAWEQVELHKARIAVLELQVQTAAAEAERKTKAYAEAKRKADNEAESLRKRAAWLNQQVGHGCDDAAELLQEYRNRG